MDAPIHDPPFITQSQPNPTSTTGFDSLDSTDPTNNKRPSPESPEGLPATEKQTQRQIRRRNSFGDMTELKPLTKKQLAAQKNLADKVLEILSSPEVLDSIIPVLASKIGQSLSTMIEQQVNERVQAETKSLREELAKQSADIKHNETKICKQFIEISHLERVTRESITAVKERERDIDALYQKIADLEYRLENQEQYSRRTSLRFHNVPVPIGDDGKIAHPVNTDQLILDICNQKMKLNIQLQDIGRTHVIGKVRNGKSQVIVRFISYRTRHLVYSNKKALKNDSNGTFISENLTQFRTSLVKRIAKLKNDNQIEAYWTFDGRIFVKRTEDSTKLIINCHDDISNLERRIREQPPS